MTLLKLSVMLAGLCAASQLATSDYIFSDRFEQRECDGVDCSYCSPADPNPVCGGNSHCSATASATSVCSYPAGSGTTGTACSELADCASAFACVNTGDIGSQCRQWCVRPAGACPGAQTCLGFQPPLMTGTTEWGVCL